MRQFWQALMDMGSREVQLDIVEVDGLGDRSIEISKYELLGAAEQILDQGKYVVSWKFRDGAWILHRDILNTSMPAPAQPTG